MGFTSKGYRSYWWGSGHSYLYVFKTEAKTGKIMMINTSTHNPAGVKEFYNIWYTLDKYENKLNLDKVGK